MLDNKRQESKANFSYTKFRRNNYCIYQTFPTFERAIFVIGFKIGYYSILLNNSVKLYKNI